MKTKWQPLYHTAKIVIMFAFLLSLVTPASIVFADDAPPPPETPEVVDVPVDENIPQEDEALPADETPESEELVGEEPAADESTSEDTVLEEPTADESASEDTVLDEPSVDEPTADEPAAESDEAQAEEEPVLAQVPEGTDVVVVDGEGEVVPLVTQEAADVIANSDPMWCPDGVDPIANTNGCTDSYTSITDLLAALSVDQPTQDGTIWIEATYDSSVAEPGSPNNITIDGNNYTTWRDYSLTVQGGWDGTDAGTVSGTSLFSGTGLRIVNWHNDVAVKNIVVDGASGGPSLVVEVDSPSAEAYNVTVENVEVKNNSDDIGAYIDNNESTGSVIVKNSKFTNNADDGLQIRAMGDVSLLDVISTGNNGGGVLISNTASNTSATVQILGTNVFSGNSGNGLYIRSDGTITLNSITAEGNGDDGVDISNTSSSTNATVNVTGTNSFSGNAGYGLFVSSNGAITLSNITANGNTTNSGAYLRNNYSGAIGGVTVTGTNSFSNNANDGLIIYSNGTISLNETTADGNGANGAGLNNGSGNGDVIITGYHNSFSNNAGLGLNVLTTGNIELYFATINGNGLNGAQFATPGTTSRSARVYCSTFENNNGGGLDAWNFENSLTFVGQNNFSGNPSGDYRFNGTASFEDPDYLCEEPVLGCTDPTAFNYDPDANTDDGSCIPVVLGCTDPTAFNYDPEANTDDGSCIPVVLGCTDPTAFNYDPEANTDDESCIPVVLGCTNPIAYNYNSLANTDDGTCRLPRTRDITDNTIIPVTGGQFTTLTCDTPLVSLQMPNGDYVTFGNLCGYEAMLGTVAESGLSGALPDGSQYVSGLNVALAQDSSTVEPLPTGTNMTVAFKVPSGMEGETFAILHWNGSNWVEENVIVENGFVKATSSNTGMFVLVAQ